MGFLLGMMKIVFSFHICTTYGTYGHIKSTEFFQRIELQQEFRLVRSVVNDKYVLTMLNDKTTSSIKRALETCSCERKSGIFWSIIISPKFH